MTRFSSTPEKTRAARRLRKDMTPAEKKLWRKLRSAGAGVSFRRQHPCGPYVLDFYAPPVNLAVEVDGEQHGFEGCQLRDARRTEFLAEQGIQVIRFWNHEIFENCGSVAETIWARIEELKAGKISES